MRNLPVLNGERLVPGVVVTNNVVNRAGTAGIRFSGDPNTPAATSAVAAVPFGRIVNNTIYGGLTPTGIGIQVTENASPSILNNIIANTATDIAVDATSTSTVIGVNLFAGKATPVTPNDPHAIVLASAAGLFVDPANRNFYPTAGSPAIDSSLNILADRNSIKVVKSIVGIPESPILAPARDLYGQLRVDTPVPPPDDPGLGDNIFKDRGAVERADFLGPTAQLVDPQDNDGGGVDLDPGVDSVIINNLDLSQFRIKLLDSGIGIDDSSVTSAKFTLTSNGVTLVAGTDYQFVYNANTDEAFFYPTSGLWTRGPTYVIRADNTPGTGIRDFAGNALQANKLSGETSFTIATGAVSDWGNAPDSTLGSQYNYHTRSADLVAAGPSHAVVPGFRLGATNAPDADGQPSLLAGADVSDDGLVSFNLQPGAGNVSTLVVNATFPGTAALDVWIDLNVDGDFEDASDHVLLAAPLTSADSGVNKSFTLNLAAGGGGPTFLRMRLTAAGIGSPNGAATEGEVEDHRVTLQGPEFNNSANPADVNNDGDVTPIDILTVVNFMSYLTGQLQPGFTTLVLSNPMTVPPYGGPTGTLPPPTFDPTGGGVPGQGKYIDVAAPFGILNAQDILGVLAGLAAAGGVAGEGEGAGESSASASGGQSRVRGRPAVCLVERRHRRAPGEHVVRADGRRLDLARGRARSVVRGRGPRLGSPGRCRPPQDRPPGEIRVRRPAWRPGLGCRRLARRRKRVA